jgi:hypothetical protein
MAAALKFPRLPELSRTGVVLLRDEKYDLRYWQNPPPVIGGFVTPTCGSCVTLGEGLRGVPRPSFALSHDLLDACISTSNRKWTL